MDRSKAAPTREFGVSRRTGIITILIGLMLAARAVAAGLPDVPTVPVGLDAYRQWDRWPQQRIGVRAYMRGTYDRMAHNGDAGNFLYQLGEDWNVTLDVQGPGILYFCRYNHWHGSPWHYEVDGADHIVQETTSADPLHRNPKGVFMPEAMFPPPLTATWSQTKGADLTWVPIGFEKSFRMAYSRTHYGTGYYIYHQFVGGTPLSQPVRAWDGKTLPDAADVLDLINRSGTDIAPRGEGVVEQSGHVDLAAKSPSELVLLPGPGMIRAIQFSVPKERALDLASVRLKITWDGRADPSVDAPLPLFYGTGTLYNRDDKEYLVKSFPMTVRFDAERAYLACYFPMPYFKSARLELVNDGESAMTDVAWAVRETPFTGSPSTVGYFHATYHDIPTPERGKDMVLLDTRGVEGSDVWSGSFVGTSYIFTHDCVLGTLEGDPRFFFDDSQTPQAVGTGTEEWGGGGDYWEGGQTMTLPFAGHPVGCTKLAQAKNQIDKLHSAYRFLLADLFPFGRNARIQLEHGGVDESKEHYETVTYWYGLPAASLVPTDELKIADAASEKAHQYDSPDASEPYEITSRYEWGPDHLGKDEIFPAHTDQGRVTSGPSAFTLKLDPANVGVMLRRTLDYQYPNQRAEVWIADASDPAKTLADSDFKLAGIWYLAGANTYIHSSPKGELAPAEHTVKTSNRRFRDDEFLVPRDLTAGRSAVRVRVKFTPVPTPLFPGQAVGELKWSEIRYAAYCFVMPSGG